MVKVSRILQERKGMHSIIVHCSDGTMYYHTRFCSKKQFPKEVETILKDYGGTSTTPKKLHGMLIKRNKGFPSMFGN